LKPLDFRKISKPSPFVPRPVLPIYNKKMSGYSQIFQLQHWPSLSQLVGSFVRFTLMFATERCFVWNQWRSGCCWMSLTLLGCAPSAPVETFASPPATLPQAVHNMPLNSERRCVGIAGVVEAIAEAKLVASVESPETCAEQVYQHLLTKQPLKLPTKIELNKQTIPIESKDAIDQIGSLVADKFKRNHERLLETENGAIRIIVARSQYLPTKAALDDLINSDVDGLVFIAGDGKRTFPDGEAKETNHAFLVQRLPTGKYVVFDPNEPGKGINLNIRITDHLLELEWTGQYRDTGKITTQRYHVVDAKKCLAAYDDTKSQE
jgi:hypothetical protein